MPRSSRPAYGSPFIHNLDEGRRYARIEDFRNFVKLAYMANSLHHSGGTICEPVDLPVNKRHLDMVYSHIKYSDKPFMGSVTAPERAADSVEMAKIAFGDEHRPTGNCAMLISLINVNSPMVYDATMLGALKVYARANQATIVTPFILAGAMSPVTVAGTLRRSWPRRSAGMAFAQLVNPGAPVVFGSFASSMSMQSGAPTFGTPEPALVLFARRSWRAAWAFRSAPAAACAPPRSPTPRRPTRARRPCCRRCSPASILLHAAGWLEGGLAIGLREVHDGCRPGRHDAHAARRAWISPRTARRWTPSARSAPALTSSAARTPRRISRRAFYRSPLADNNSFEQWQAEGSLDMAQRANALWKQQLADYVEPPLDPAIDEALLDFIESAQGRSARLEHLISTAGQRERAGTDRAVQAGSDWPGGGCVRSRPYRLPTGCSSGPAGHDLAQLGIRRRLVRDRHRLDEVLLEARLDGGLDLLDRGARAPRSSRAGGESRSAMRAPVPAALPAERDAWQVAVGDHAEDHRVLRRRCGCRTRRRGGCGRRCSMPSRSISSRNAGVQRGLARAGSRARRSA